MKVIWKFGLTPERGSDRCMLPLPCDREVLSVGSQDGGVVIWAAVDPDDSRYEVAQFVIAGTGEPLPTGVRRGTVQMPDGFVWHVFEQVSDGD